MKVKSPRFDMPWHVATLNEERAQYIVPLHFLIILWGFDLSCPWVFRIDPHATLVAPDDNENTIQKSITPFQKGDKGDLNFFPCSVIARSVLCDVAILFIKIFYVHYSLSQGNH